jgi:ornithine carbamoyltransferase
MADYLTLKEKWGDVKGGRLTYIGDGNNICHSLMVIGAKLGVHVTVCTPKGYEPRDYYVAAIQKDLSASGGSYTFVEDPVDSVKEAGAIYTDVWASMGQEEEAEDRRKVFMPFQVNERLVDEAPADVLIMHDLPAHRGEEITSQVLDSPNSIAFDQAENRLHAQKGILAYLDRESE